MAMTNIALLGAGGKMGMRLSTNLQGSEYNVAHVEVSEAGRQRLAEATGLQCVDQSEALANADVVLLAVPDHLIGKIAHTFIDQLRPGTALIMLDAAAPYAGELPERDDITYFITHPCHPPIFNDEVDEEARKDFFGGVKAKQHIVCALMQGPEAHYALCEGIARTIFKPVMRSNRCSLENMAFLEPALSETVGATLCMALRDARDEAVRKGVPEQAATDFILGHLNVELAIAFDVFPGGQFSDGALYAISRSKARIFREGWLERVFSREEVQETVHEICNPPSNG